MQRNFTAAGADIGKRLDVFLKGEMPGYSRAFLQRAIAAGEVQVNSKKAKSNLVLRAGDTIAADIPEASKALSAHPSLAIPIIFENDDFLVINKPAGIAVHPTSFPGGNTVANWLIARYPNIHGVGDAPLRPGIVHRLDRWTSGVMVIAKTQQMFDYLKGLFKTRTVKKEYLAILEGRLIKREGMVEGYLMPSTRDYRRKQFQIMALTPKAKSSRTHFTVERYIGDATLVKFFPETGRTHQVRVHAKHLGHPIFGDRIYGAKRPIPKELRHRFFLHAEHLTFTLPDGHSVRYGAPAPEDFKQMLAGLQSADR